MGEYERQSQDTELAVLKKSIETMTKQIETNNEELRKVLDAIHRVELDNKSLYMTEKHHTSRLDGIDATLKKHVTHIDGLELASSQLKGGLFVAKLAFGVISGVFAVILSVCGWLLAQAYEEIKQTHDIAILNQQEVQRLTQYPEDKRK